MKKNKIKLSIVFMVLGTAALACSIPLLVPPANPAEDIGETHAAQMTNVAEDVIATLDAVTSTPSPVPVTNTPVPTSTMLPTQIPAPTKTPVPTEPPAPPSLRVISHPKAPELRQRETARRARHVRWWCC